MFKKKNLLFLNIGKYLYKHDLKMVEMLRWFLWVDGHRGIVPFLYFFK